MKNDRDEASAPEGNNFARLLFDMANSAEVLEAAQRSKPVMTMVEQRKIVALLAAYEKACLDPHARIPTAMHAAIEGFRK